MTVLMILGSRNPSGQTAGAAKALAEELTAAGHSVEEAYLPLLAMERCRQCNDDGWGICRTEGRCVIEDEFPAIVEKIRAAEAVVFATPVYFSDLSESLRALLDRLRRTCVNQAGRDGIAGKVALGLCVAGGGGGGAPQCAASLDRVLATCGFDVVDMIPVRRQNLTQKLPSLRSTGQWLAKRLKA